MFGKHRDHRDFHFGHFAHFAMGRHGGRHRFGRGGHGFFGRGGDDFPGARRLSSQDLQLVILALLVDKAAHGYELIKIIEERSEGFYTPSPGVIYPALTYLEETGQAEVEVSGTKKLYRITESGQKRVDDNRDLVEVTLAKLTAIGEKMARVREVFDGGDEDGRDNPFDRHGSGDVHRARHLLRSALRSKFPWSKAEGARIAAILERAAADIIRGETKNEDKTQADD